jgi:hypothetical protein
MLKMVKCKFIFFFEVDSKSILATKYEMYSPPYIPLSAILIHMHSSHYIPPHYFLFNPTP